jgi:hypothetical protein
MITQIRERLHRLIIFNLLILELFNICLYAADKADGGLPGYFLTQGAGSRALAMGRTFVAVCDDVTAVYWNPAGLNQLDREGVHFTYMQLYENTQYNFIGYARPIFTEKEIDHIWTYGVGLIYLNSGELTRRDDWNYPAGTFSDQNTAVLLSGSYNNQDMYDLGFSFKIINKKIESLDSTGYGLDLSYLAYLTDDIKAGINLQNVIGAKLQRDILTDEIPLTAKLGLAWSSVDNALTVAADVDCTVGRSIKPHLGVEYFVHELVAIRAGYDNETVSVGAGLKLIPDMDIDYAFMNNPDLNLSHRVSLEYKFGQSMSELIEIKTALKVQIDQLLQEASYDITLNAWREAEKKLKEVITNLDPKNQAANDNYNLVTVKLQEIDDHFNAGKQNIDSADWIKAQVEFQKVIELEPGNPEAQWYLSRVGEMITWSEGMRTIIVMQFKGVDVPDTVVKEVRKYLNAELVVSRLFNVLDRENIRDILEAQKIAWDTCTDEECLVKLGQFTSARQAVIGTISPTGMDIKLVDMETSKINYYIPNVKIDISKITKFEDSIIGIADEFIREQKKMEKKKADELFVK